MTEQDRLTEIRTYRARMFVPENFEKGRDLVDRNGSHKIAVFQHTLDDYDFLLGMIDDYGLGR